MASCSATEAAAGCVRLEDFSWTPADAARATLRGAELSLGAGQCALVTGPTGSGKTTLLRAIAGVLPAGGRAGGRIATGGRAALLLQAIDPQLLFTTVEEEVASGLRGGAAGRGGRVAGLLAAVGLAGFEKRAVDTLSAGEKQRVVLAALLALEPAVLLLDEPTSALDAPGRQRLATLLAACKRRGHSLVIAEHAFAPFLGLADRSWRLDGGSVREGPLPPAPRNGCAPQGARRACGGHEILRCDAVAVRGIDGRSLLGEVRLRVGSGQRQLVTGPNGSGKTTLLRAIAGLVPPSAGRIRLAAPGLRRGRGVALLFQNPQQSLFERSVGDEIAFPLRRAGGSRAAVERRVDEVLDSCGLAPLRDASPLRLSFGEQHRVAIASALAPGPALLLLDEPFAGLDLRAREDLLELLAREQQRTRMAILLASHDEEPYLGWVHGRLALARGAGGRDA